MRRFIRRPSPAMVVACIALFVAMGGVSYGLATGVIDSREIKNNTVRGKDVRNGTLTGKDVKRDGLGGCSVNEGTPRARCPRRRRSATRPWSPPAAVHPRTAACPAWRAPPRGAIR